MELLGEVSRLGAAKPRMGRFSVPNLTSGWRPPWLHIVCRSRNFSSQTLFRFGECADLAYKMLYALQNPMHVAFMKAHFVDTEVPEGFGLASLRDPKLHVFEHTSRWTGMLACSLTNA